MENSIMNYDPNSTIFIISNPYLNKNCFEILYIMLCSSSKSNINCTFNLYSRHIFYLKNYEIIHFAKNNLGYNIYCNNYEKGNIPILTIILYDNSFKIELLRTYERVFTNYNCKGQQILKIVENAYKEFNDTNEEKT